MSKPLCILQAPLLTRSGYGDWSMAVAKSLLRYDKFDLKVVPTRWGATPSRHAIEEMNDDMEKELFSRILRSPLTKQPELFIQITIPNEFQAMAKYNIGMTAGIETTVPPGPWLEGLNRMDINVAISSFCKEVLTKASFVKKAQNGMEEELKNTKPMEVVCWGANTDVYKKTDATIDSVESVMNDIKEDWCFAFVGQWTHGGTYNDRKDIGNLIKTFLKTFKNEKNKPALVLKTSGVSFSKIDKNDILGKIHEIKNEVGGNDLPNVYLLHGDLSDEEMNAFYNHSKIKAFVNFTHGEGYGHPLLLASLSGKPILVSNWSGHLDFLNKDYTNLLNGEVLPVDGSSVNDWIIKESAWFYVNYEQASKKMKGLLDNDVYAKLLDKAEKLRVENMEKFSMQAMDKNFHTFLDKYVPEFPQEQKIVLPKLKKIELPKLTKVG